MSNLDLSLAPDATPRSPSGVEQALFAGLSSTAIDRWVAHVVAARLDSPVRQVLFRAGRVDAVYGLRLLDGREVVLKVHRPPTTATTSRTPTATAISKQLSQLAASIAGQQHLFQNGYPCPEPLHGPEIIEGRTVTIQSLLAGGNPAEARRPTIRAAMAASYAEHISLLETLPGGLATLATQLGPGPAWTQYEHGPWPVPHDTVFDFSTTPAGWGWLDDFASQASAAVHRTREASPVVVAHADWYAGNLRFIEDQVVAVFDWELVAGPEAVLVGLFAGGFYAEGAPAAADVAAYLDDYDQHRALGGRARQAAEAAARWMLAFNARCDLALLDGAPDPQSPLGRLLQGRTAYYFAE